MSKITELASGQMTAVDMITVELVEADEHPPLLSFAGQSSRPSFTLTVSPLQRIRLAVSLLLRLFGWLALSRSGGCEAR